MAGGFFTISCKSSKSSITEELEMLANKIKSVGGIKEEDLRIYLVRMLEKKPLQPKKEDVYKVIFETEPNKLFYVIDQDCIEVDARFEKIANESELFESRQELAPNGALFKAGDFYFVLLTSEYKIFLAVWISIDL